MVECGAMEYHIQHAACCLLPAAATSHRWANNLPNEAEVSNGAFFRDSKAQALFRDYLAFMIPKFK
jgi:hypothetical protein